MTIDEIKALIDIEVDTNPETFRDAKKIALINKAQNIVVNTILESDTISVFDDQDYGDLNEGYIDIVSGQTVYDLSQDENFADVLYVVKIFAQYSGTSYEPLRFIGTTDYGAQGSLSGYPFFGFSGIDTFYRMSGKRLILGFTPTANAANGIHVYFQRVPKPVISTDTTRQLAIPSTFHHLVALMAAYDYARAKRMDIRNDILAEILVEKNNLQTFIANQDRQALTTITTPPRRNR